ncbi:MAG: cell shape-determining protein, partial [Myxococcales bacterium]|nr:cell shape-determining protein [Myxococcales bacterium]
MPTVTDVRPNVGTTAGGMRVTLTGVNFRSADQVTFGGVPGTKLLVSSATSLSVNAPALAAGTHDVLVHNSKG